MQKWEYIIGSRWGDHNGKGSRWVIKVEGNEYPTMTDMLNALGEQGWELVSVENRWQSDEYNLFLKRPKE